MSRYKKVLLIVLWVLFLLCVSFVAFFAFTAPERDKIAVQNVPSSYQIISQENFIDYQSVNECSAYASAFVMRHLGKRVVGLDLYKGVKRTFGFASALSVERLFGDNGFSAKAYHGGVETLKKRVSGGVPVIAFINNDNDTHYVVVVGYDNENFYLVDSIRENANADGGWYNRKLSIVEFERVWKTNAYFTGNVYIVAE